MFGADGTNRSREVQGKMAIEGRLAGARERATIEMIGRHEAALKRTARRYSLCAEDAEDAYQRALEIALTKAPTDRPQELIRWTQTVTKHEALAIRRKRERLLGNRPSMQQDDGGEDWLSLVPAGGSGPGESVVRREAVARSREALRSLKPAELRALTLLAEGYSYAEISSITGYSATKVNRCLAEGRESLRRFLARSEAGELCGEVAPLLSRYCDGELRPGEGEAVGEHLRACASCRAAARAYRAAPEAAAALVPAVLLPRTLLDRLHDALSWLQSRLPGGEAPVATAAGAPGAGAGLAGAVKFVAACAAAGGTAAACVAVGIAPGGLRLDGSRQRTGRIERSAKSLLPASPRHGDDAGGSARTEPRDRHREPVRRPERDRSPQDEGAAAASAPEYAEPVAAPEPAPLEAEPVSAEPAEAAPPTPPPPKPAGEGSAAGEFGP
jgi:RNA polymerase sigma factor (sigma-70 family)